MDKKGEIRKKGKKKRERKTDRGRKEERVGKKREIFSVFRCSNLDGLRVKVDPRNKGYAWIPKSGSFVKL